MENKELEQRISYLKGLRKGYDEEHTRIYRNPFYVIRKKRLENKIAAIDAELKRIDPAESSRKMLSDALFFVSGGMINF